MATEVKETVNIKIAVLGKSLVGKSALTYRFINDIFPNEHDTTIEDQYKVIREIDNFKCNLEILDTAGQDDYQAMLDTWINFGEAFLLVYSIDSKESFDSIREKYDRIVRNKDKEPFSIVLVGNKCDLEDKRAVSMEEASLYAKSIGVGLIETSALNRVNVNEAFHMLCHEILKRKEKKEEQSGDKCCFIF